MSETINLGPVVTGGEAARSKPQTYFNNLSLPPFNITQDIGDAVQNFFEKVTGNKDSAQILASAVVYTSSNQGINPMETLQEFQQMPPGQLNEYLAAFLNFNRIGTSLLGVNNNPFASAAIRRTVIL